MKKVLIVCGWYEGPRKAINKNEFDKIIGFEPNMYLYYKGKEKLLNNEELHNKAVFTYNGKITFYHKKILGASGLFKYKSQEEVIKEYEVDCIDFNEFIKKYKKDNDEIIHVAMNIEGSEFEIIQKLLDSEIISLIDKIYLDFHVNHMIDEKINHLEWYNELIEKLKIIYNFIKPDYSGCPHDWILIKKI